MTGIPRLQSSPPPPPNVNIRKRKAVSDDDEDDDDDYQHRQPRKVAAMQGDDPESKQPLRNVAVNKVAGAGPKKGVANGKPHPGNLNAPKALTRPKQPQLTSTTRNRTRGTSAPPTIAPPVAPVSIPTNRPATRSTSSNVRTGITASNATSRALVSKPPGALATIDERRFLELQHQVTSLQSQHQDLCSQVHTSTLTTQATTDELAAAQRRHRKEVSDMEASLRTKEREVRELEEDLRLCREDLERERENATSLKSNLNQHATAHVALNAQIQSLQAQITMYQSRINDQTSSLSGLRYDMDSQIELIAKLREDALEHERVRRKLHNMVMELKGNIRVFARVRPLIRSEEEAGEGMANMSFPGKVDNKEIVISMSSESAMGNERTDIHNFNFDRVFDPLSTQSEIFDEISQLAQSCTDGYNVCIFAYGQTGSGKSWTMEGGQAPEDQGMIPRAVEQVFRDTEDLKLKGWEYDIQGQFLEIYNESITDLLSSTAPSSTPNSSSGESSKTAAQKHEIKHDAKTHSTSVTNVVVHTLTSPRQVFNLLAHANSRRKTATTMMNERSSRSHSVFTLRISGKNTKTGEQCRGCLNLVDLAGSERMSATSGVKPGDGRDERVKETKCINKSLSSLGDVIAALGEKGSSGNADAHVPYRNSKLTYLLQYSLSGNSKTLMILNLSPLAAHLSESLTSLRFATKVNNTNIGTAKKQTR